MQWKGSGNKKAACSDSSEEIYQGGIRDEFHQNVPTPSKQSSISEEEEDQQQMDLLLEESDKTESEKSSQTESEKSEHSDASMKEDLP